MNFTELFLLYSNHQPLHALKRDKDSPEKVGCILDWIAEEQNPTGSCRKISPGWNWKKVRAGCWKVEDMKVWLYANRDQKLKKLMGMLNLKLSGHYRYYSVSFNGRMISNYKQQVREMLKYYPLVMPKIYVSLF